MENTSVKRRGDKCPTHDATYQMRSLDRGKSAPVCPACELERDRFLRDLIPMVGRR